VGEEAGGFLALPFPAYVPISLCVNHRVGPHLQGEEKGTDVHSKMISGVSLKRNMGRTYPMSFPLWC